jgi:hypothetical protein
MHLRPSERPAVSRRRFAPRLALAASLALTAAGCLTMETPPEFLVIDDDTSEVRAVTPDDARLWAREFDDPLRGSLAFWSETLKTDLTVNRGYTLIQQREVKTKSGRPGVELDCEVTAQGAARGYLVTLFIVEGWMSNTIQVVEFTAPKNAFDSRVEAVRSAIATIRP